MKTAQVQKDVNKAKNILIRKAKKNGLWEDFGQKEVKKLEDKYIDISDYSEDMNQCRKIIANFDEWACNCGSNDI